MASFDEQIPNGLLRYRVLKVEERVGKIESKLDRLIMAAVIATFTFSGAMLLLALNLLVLRRG